MNRRFLTLLQLLLLSSFLANAAYARGAGGGREEDHIVSNGQGISSPSFWDGLKGENPAGLTQNTSLKLQGGLAAFDSDFNPVKPSGALLIGNGLLGAGLEYSTYSSGALPSGSSLINWGIAGYLSSLSTSLGVSGHHQSGSNGGSYDLGVIIGLGSSVKLGVLVPNFTNGLDVLGGGLTFSVDRSIDLVLDSSANLSGGSPHLMFKPGLSIHLDSITATAAYGFGSDTGANLIAKDLTAGLGFSLGRKLMIGYEYQGAPKHRFGLTLKLD